MSRDLRSLALSPFSKRRGEMIGTLSQRRSKGIQENYPDRVLPLRFVVGWINGGSGDVEATSQGICLVDPQRGWGNEKNKPNIRVCRVSAKLSSSAASIIR